MVFYLKYRPQKISELDLPDIRQSLVKIMEKGKVPHALLFSGPRGSGKTSAARIVAKAVNCLKNKGRGEPCNHCPNCQEIIAGSFIDLLEIDGASNRGIDDVRSLRENIRLTPSRGKFKVYIIDEVHMLTTEAFNALLKTLEEPPGHVLFILCTTAPEKLPETILSRCMSFRFRKAKPAEIRASLEKVVKGEKLKVEKGALELIAGRVDGSFRDGQKILDQLAAGGKISLRETKKLLGQIEALSPLKLIGVLVGREIKEGLLEINRLIEAGVDLKIYLQSLLEMLRQVLLVRLGVGEFEEPMETKSLSTREIKELIGLFSRAGIGFKTTIIPQLPLELAVIEWGQTVVKQSGLSRSPEPESKEVKASLGQPPKVQVAAPENGDGVKRLKEIETHWEEVLSGVKPLNHSVSALLKACRPLRVKGEILTLEVFYPFHKERLETERCRGIVEEVATNVLSAPIKIKCVLGKRKEGSSLSNQSNGTDVSGNEENSSDVLSTAEQIFNGEVED